MRGLAFTTEGPQQLEPKLPERYFGNVILTPMPLAEVVKGLKVISSLVDGTGEDVG